MRSPRAFLFAAAALFILNVAYQALIPYAWGTVMRAMDWRELEPVATFFLFYGFPVLASVAAAFAAGALWPRMPVVQSVIALLVCLAAPLIAFEAILFGIDFGCSENWLSDCDD
jgi:hypothetical protein